MNLIIVLEVQAGPVGAFQIIEVGDKIVLEVRAGPIGAFEIIEVGQHGLL